MQTKKIIAITTISTIATAGLANAQTLNLTDTQKGIFEQAMSLFRSGKTTDAKALLEQNNMKPSFHKMKHGKHGHGKMHGNRKEIEEAIAAGDYAKFVQVASSSPMAKIDQNTFNSLTPHFQALKNARTNIENILKAAGIERPAGPKVN
jgi:hypothetical protein